MTDIIAAAINSHAVGGVSAGTHTACHCNRMWVTNADYRAHVTEHVAAELAAAGYGNMADVWDEGRDAVWSLLDRRAQGRNEPTTRNPYRGAGHE
jgi:hypothetical protein